MGLIWSDGVMGGEHSIRRPAGMCQDMIVSNGRELPLYSEGMLFKTLVSPAALCGFRGG